MTAKALEKGQEMILTEEIKGLSKVFIRVSWKDGDREKKEEPVKKSFWASLFSLNGNKEISPLPVHCNLFAILLQNGRLANIVEDVVSFGHRNHDTESVKLTNDNKTTLGSDEQIEIKLEKIPIQYNKILIGLNVFDSGKRNHHFGLLEKLTIHFFDANNTIDSEICNYELKEKYFGKTSCILGELYVKEGEWNFKPTYEATKDAFISDIAKRYQ